MFDFLKITLSALWTDKRGVTAVEYALIAGLIAVAIVASFNTLATSITGAVGTAATSV
jgi:pilus assembly protein Flp/PilA